LTGSSIADASGVGVITSDTVAAAVERFGGGKGRGLFELTAGGVDVPPWVVLGTDVLRRVREAAGLDDAIDGELSGLTEESDDQAIQAAADRIAELLVAAEIDGATQADITDAYTRVGGGAVAVRSSAMGEDSALLSFAGQYSTFLNVVGGDAVIDAIRSCWASAWSANALRYRLMNNLSLRGIEMAVVIQAIVAAETSGVLFTINPATGNDQEFVVSATYGLGETVVSGAVDPDTFVLDRVSGAVRDRTLGAKEERVDPLPDGGGCETRAVDLSERVVAALSSADLDQLHHAGRRLEELMGGPQDVEWAFANGKLWILQSRPVTGGLPSSVEARLWDNSNINESYGNIVAPLTYTFARHAYHRVHRQYLELLGVSDRQVASMEEWLPQLLGYFDGRVYYNLLSWYRIARLIPFYSINRQVLEISMGAEHLDDEIAEQQQPYAFRNRFEGILVRGRVAVHFFWYFGTIHRLVGDFVDRFYEEYDDLNTREYDGLRAAEIYSMFVDMERRLLVRWGRMIMLEYTVGLSVGSLYKLTQRWLPDAPEWFLFEAIKAPDVESVEPLRRLDELAETILADQELLQMVRSATPDVLDGVVRSAEGDSPRALVEMIDAYLDEFGYRNANELKLEEPDLREDPTTFYTMLQSAIGRLEATEVVAKEERPTADAYLAANLGGWRLRIFNRLRGRVQRLIVDRERVRFCRTRIFGLSRRMFRAAGDDLARSGVLDDPADIFYLRLEELRGCFEGTVLHREMGSLVELRKEQQASNRSRDVPHRFWTRGGVYWDSLDRGWAEALQSELPSDGQLKGTPCSPGVVTQQARVIDEPGDVEGGVLVTYRTDPGWAGAIRTASALLVERGSPLTHVAVVARELGIPTIVQIPGLTKQVHSGMEITVDGGTGTIKLPVDGEANADG